MQNTKSSRQSLITRIMNPKYIMVYATVIIFLIIYAFGAIVYGEKGFTTLRTFVNFFTDNAYYGISAVGMTMVRMMMEPTMVPDRLNLPPDMLVPPMTTDSMASVS